jgi:hypothetical protein
MRTGFSILSDDRVHDRVSWRWRGLSSGKCWFVVAQCCIATCRGRHSVDAQIEAAKSIVGKPQACRHGVSRDSPNVADYYFHPSQCSPVGHMLPYAVFCETGPVTRAPTPLSASPSRIKTSWTKLRRRSSGSSPLRPIRPGPTRHLRPTDGACAGSARPPIAPELARRSNCKVRHTSALSASRA